MIHNGFLQAGKRAVKNYGAIALGFSRRFQSGYRPHGDAHQNNLRRNGSILVPMLDVSNASQDIVSFIIAQRDYPLITGSVGPRIVEEGTLARLDCRNGADQHFDSCAKQAVSAEQNSILAGGWNKPSLQS